MRTYDQTPSPEQVAEHMHKIAGLALRGEVYRIVHERTSKQGNPYLVTCYGFIHRASNRWYAVETDSKGNVRYRMISHVLDKYLLRFGKEDVGTLVEKEPVAAKLGSMAKSLDW